ncbi:MAG: hypothetical protein KGI08_11460 [Thaumarchaeota archaeon]|nr:hypothetical protein [Nitrososphaerota archaeon]
MLKRFEVGDEIEWTAFGTTHYKGIVTQVHSEGFTADIYHPKVIKGYHYYYYRTDYCEWSLLKPVDPIKRLNDKVKAMWERQPYVKRLERLEQCRSAANILSGMS